MDEVVKTLRTHLTKAAENEMRIGKIHSKIASHHALLASDGVEAAHNEKLSQLHEDLASAHADAGQGHVDCAQELAECSDGDNKLARAADTTPEWTHGEKPLSSAWGDVSKVRGVLPSPTLIGRPGGPPISAESADSDTEAIDRFAR